MSWLGRRSALRWLVWLIVGGLVLGLGYWAGSATLRPPVRETTQRAQSTYAVKSGHVAKGLAFAAEARWPVKAWGVNGASGTVTRRLVPRNGIVAEGAPIYAVDERETVVAKGEVPSYRDLAVGSRGTDVLQLERFLTRRGFASGLVDGVFSSATRAAVMAWQRAEGRPIDGAVRRGDVIFVPKLPARIALTKAIVPGSQVSPGAAAVRIYARQPAFSIQLGGEQKAAIAVGTSVVVTGPERKWHGSVESSSPDAQGGILLKLQGRGGPLCGRDCASVPVGLDTRYPVSIIVVPKTSGPLVPAAAIQVDASGETFVELSDGRRRPVEVIASDSGWSVVDGVAPGDVVRLTGSSS